MQIIQYITLIAGLFAQITVNQPQVQPMDSDLTMGLFPEVPTNEKIIVGVTGYSSSVDQTDNTPFETASGKAVRDGIIACNFLPFGTKVKFPEYFGDKIFVVEDRMARRHVDRVDIWFETRCEAVNFGVKVLEMELVSN